MVTQTEQMRCMTGEADTQLLTSLYRADTEVCPVVITILA